MAAIGTAREYNVVLERTSTLPAPDSTDTATILAEIPWTNLHYERVANDVSGTRVALPVQDAADLALHAWDTAIAVYRNGLRVWGGPVMGWQLDENDMVQIAARDIFAFASKEFLFTNRTFTAMPAGSIISQLVNDISSGLGSNVPWQNMDPLTLGYGPSSTLSRTYAVAEMKSLAVVLGEMVTEAGFTYTAGPRYAHFDESAFNFGHAAPVLHEGSVMKRPLISVDGSNVATDVFMVGAAGGVGGYAHVENASLVNAPTGQWPAYSQDFVLQNRAEPSPRLAYASLIQSGAVDAVRALFPEVTIEAMTLAPSFGSVSAGYSFTPGVDFELPGESALRGFRDFNDLIPGMRADWGFEATGLPDVGIARFGEVTSEYISYRVASNASRVKLIRLDVDVSADGDGLDEVVKAAFEPVADRGTLNLVLWADL